MQTQGYTHKERFAPILFILPFKGLLSIENIPIIKSDGTPNFLFNETVSILAFTSVPAGYQRVQHLQQTRV